ncbi:unnamed protein product [Pieris brassicae]|uniref:Uncharacterized protein n=1 Tax=Pieris brassicae TaxID=7116 RepID=A0A9P0XGB1_PIEBR|nr:unnamed protein product [Pieris brassicae]
MRRALPNSGTADGLYSMPSATDQTPKFSCHTSSLHRVQPNAKRSRDFGEVYRKTTYLLLEINNIDIPPELEQQTEYTSALEDCNNVANRQKKKKEKTTEISPETEKLIEETEAHKNSHLEEDIRI